MKSTRNMTGRVFAGAIAVAIAMLATTGLAQDKQGGGQSHVAPPQRRSPPKSTPTRTTTTRSSAPRTSSVKTAGRTTAGSPTRTATRVRVAGRKARRGAVTRSSTNVSSPGNNRPMRMQNGSTGRGISATTWRASNPNWNGGYFYRGGAYYYDSGFAYPAVVVNEWSGIAALAGGVAIIGLLNNDPTLVFAGSVGAAFAISDYQADLNSSNGELRLRAAYFGKPYFWRNGVRYDRIVVTDGGVQSYQFRRH